MKTEFKLIENYLIRQSDNGLELVLKGAWTDNIVDVMIRKRITSLWINYAQGFIGDDIRFLRKLPFLTRLLVLVYNIDDLSPINDLHLLVSLTIGCRKFSGIDFANFPDLEYVGLDWQNGVDSLLESVSLKRLRIGHIPRPDLTTFAGLSNLTHLYLMSSATKSLAGLECLNSLTNLGLYRLTKLEDISSLAYCPSLQVLDVQACRRIHDIGAIKYLPALKRLRLADCGSIATVSPVEKINGLVDLMFDGDTTIEDGNLTPITAVSSLRYVLFRDRKHYTHNSKEFPRSSTPQYFP